MKKSIVIILLLTGFSGLSQSLAPTVIASGGFDVRKGERRLSWTVGEIIVTTERQGAYILTQGFQQGPELFLSIPNINPKMEVSVFPNPVSSLLNITLKSDLIYGQGKIEVYNSFGQKMNLPFSSSRIQNGETITVDVGSLARGVYFIRIINENNSEIYSDFKVVKI